MVALILIVIFGIIFSVFATQNTSGISLHFAQYTLSNVPVYLVVLISLLIAFVISGILAAFDSITSAFMMFGKDRKIQDTQNNLKDTKRRIRELEVENEQLRKQKLLAERSRVVSR